jgi:hypothetical protein
MLSAPDTETTEVVVESSAGLSVMPTMTNTENDFQRWRKLTLDMTDDNVPYKVKESIIWETADFINECRRKYPKRT